MYGDVGRYERFRGIWGDRTAASTDRKVSARGVIGSTLTLSQALILTLSLTLTLTKVSAHGVIRVDPELV